MEKGSFISARERARAHGVGYTPMREAFQRLHREGFLKLVPNVGYFVNTMEVVDVINVFQVRKCLEPFAIGSVIERLTAKDLQFLRDCNSDQQKKLKDNDIYGYMDCDEAFHLRFFIVLGNPYLYKTYKNTREQYRLCSKKIAYTFSEEVYDEHSELIDALETRDREKAVDLCLKHLEKSEQRIISGFIRVNKNIVL